MWYSNPKVKGVVNGTRVSSGVCFQDFVSRCRKSEFVYKISPTMGLNMLWSPAATTNCSNPVCISTAILQDGYIPYILWSFLHFSPAASNLYQPENIYPCRTLVKGRKTNLLSAKPLLQASSLPRRKNFLYIYIYIYAMLGDFSSLTSTWK